MQLSCRIALLSNAELFFNKKLFRSLTHIRLIYGPLRINYGAGRQVS